MACKIINKLFLDVLTGWGQGMWWGSCAQPPVGKVLILSWLLWEAPANGRARWPQSYPMARVSTYCFERRQQQCWDPRKEKPGDED